MEGKNVKSIILNVVGTFVVVLAANATWHYTAHALHGMRKGQKLADTPAMPSSPAPAEKKV